MKTTNDGFSYRVFFERVFDPIAMYRVAGAPAKGAWGGSDFLRMKPEGGLPGFRGADFSARSRRDAGFVLEGQKV
mgnify:CR=1 FL=1